MKSPSVPHLKVVDDSKPFTAHAVRRRRPCKGREFQVFTRPDTNSIERTLDLKWVLLAVLIAALACAASWYVQAGPARSTQANLGLASQASACRRVATEDVYDNEASVEPQNDKGQQQGVLSVIVRERLKAKCPRPQCSAVTTQRASLLSWLPEELPRKVLL